jgi:hypothetical protein
VRDFVAALAMIRKGMNEIKILTDQAYGNTSLKRKQIYHIIKEVKDEKNTVNQWHSNLRLT